MAFDNSNTAGVNGSGGTAATRADAAAVQTGVEIGIPLEVLGHTAGDRIAVAAFVNGSNHDFISNQVLGPLGGSDNLGEPRVIDFSTVPGDQFVVVVESETPPCPGDFNGDGQVNGADFGALLAAWGDCGGCPEDLNGDGAVNGADVGLLLAVWGLCP